MILHKKDIKTFKKYWFCVTAEEATDPGWDCGNMNFIRSSAKSTEYPFEFAIIRRELRSGIPSNTDFSVQLQPTGKVALSGLSRLPWNVSDPLQRKRVWKWMPFSMTKNIRRGSRFPTVKSNRLTLSGMMSCHCGTIRWFLKFQNKMPINFCVLAKSDV